MTLLVVGGSGFLGTELIRQAVSAGHNAVATYANRRGDSSSVPWKKLDLRDVLRIDALLAQLRPLVVVNASSGGADWKATAQGPIHLAMAAAKYGARLVHVSSDAVFSGIGKTHYDESSLPDPLTPYGAAKAAAETGILAVLPGAVVARTSLIIGHGRSEHERLVHDLASGAHDGVLFTDDCRCPVHVSDLGSALLELASSSVAGVHHLGGPEALSRYDLGVLIARRDGIDPSLLPAGRRADTHLLGGLDVRLDSHVTQCRLSTEFRGASHFLHKG